MPDIARADDSVRVGDTILPGLFQDLRIGRELIVDEFQITGRPGKVRDPLAHDDADADLRLLLLSDEESTAAEKLAQIEGVFAALEQGRPRRYTFRTAHSQARRLREVMFQRLETTEGSAENSIAASLKFVEVLSASQVAALKKKYEAQQQKSDGGSDVEKLLAKHVSGTGKPPDTAGIPAGIDSTPAPAGVRP